MPVLVDTSVWIDHLRNGNAELASLLEGDSVFCHPFVIGELACGEIKRRAEIISLLHSLQEVEMADHEEVLAFIETHKLMRMGLGYVDIHLLASAVLSRTPLWTLDRRLAAVAARLKVAFPCPSLH